MKHTLLALGLGLGLLHACAPRAVAPAAAPAAPAPTPEPIVRTGDSGHDGMSLQGGMAQIDEGEVEERFRQSLPDFNRCYKETAGRAWFLSGRLQLKVRVGAQGEVRSAAVTDSTLGNYEVERCVARVAQRVRFPPPHGGDDGKGGEAELTYPVEFPAHAAVAHWPQERVASQMASHRREVRLCLERGRDAAAGLRLTVYIGPGGKVASAGLSAENPIDERAGACLVAHAQAWRFDDPLGQLVKASYAFD